MDEEPPVTWKDFGPKEQEQAAGIVRLRTHVRQDQADDAVSAAAARLIERRETARNPQALLVKTAVNFVFSAQRRQRPLTEQELRQSEYGTNATLESFVAEEPITDEEDNDSQARRTQRLDAALAHVSAADRELLTGVYLDGRKPDAIDKEIGANPGTTKHRLDRARKRMRRVLGITSGPKRGR